MPDANARGVPPEATPSPPGLEADQPDAAVVDEPVEDAHRVGAAADAGAGRRPAAARRGRGTCARASMPMMRWKSRTISGNGCGPVTVPRT